MRPDLNDIKEDVICINKAKVQNEKKEWIIKTTKTTASTREIIVPVEIDEKIRERGMYTKAIRTVSLPLCFWLRKSSAYHIFLCTSCVIILHQK